MTDRIIRIRLDASDATRGINQVDSQMERLDGTTNRVNTSMTRLAAAVASALSVQKLAAYADSWKDLESRFRNAVGEGENAADVLSRINDIANSSFSSLQNTSEAFLLNARSLQELNFSTQQQLDLTESLSLALVVSGAKQQRAESVTVAFSKAIAAGTLRGENFNTIIQSGGEVAAALADGLGVTTIELRKMAEEGLLTADKVVPALTSQLEILRQKADEMPATIGDAFLILNNKALEYVGTLDKTVGASEKVSDSILFVANNLDALASSIAVLAVAIVGKYAAAALAATAANVALTRSTLNQVIAEKAQAQSAFFAANGIRVKSVAVAQATTAQVAYTTAINAGRAALSFLAGPAGLILLTASAFLIFSSKSKDAALSAEMLAASLDNLTSAQATSQIFQVRDAISELEKQIKATELAQRQTADAFQSSVTLGADQEATRRAYAENTAALEGLNTELEAQKTNLIELQAISDGTRAKTVANTSATNEAASVTDELVRDTSELNEKLGDLAARISLSSIEYSIFSERQKLVKDGFSTVEIEEYLTSLRSLLTIQEQQRTAAQDDQTAARINQRIEGLRLETQTISSQLELQRAVREGFFTQEAADLAAFTAQRILALNNERELVLAEQALTNEQKLQLEEAYQAQLTAITRQYSDGRIEVDRLERLTRLDLAQSFANSSISLIAAFGSKSFQAQKNAAIASGIVNIAGGVAKALNNPYPANLGFAAQVAAQGAGLISTIRSTNLGGGGGLGNISASAALPTTPQSAPTVGTLEVLGLSDLQRQLDDLDGDDVLPVSFTRRLVASLNSVQRLEGGG